MLLDKTDFTRSAQIVFFKSVGGEQRGRAVLAAYAAKTGRAANSGEILSMAKALQGIPEFKSRPAVIAMFDILNVLPKRDLPSPAAASARILPAATAGVGKPGAALKRETASRFLEEYALSDRKERAALTRQHLADFKDPESGVSPLALEYILAGKDLTAAVKLGMHFERGLAAKRGANKTTAGPQAATGTPRERLAAQINSHLPKTK
jgi:hypothetical protein